MNKLVIGLMVIGALLLSGCGSTPQPTILLDKTFTNSKKERIGIYVQTEKATTHIYGASCLLCYGIAAAATAQYKT